MDSNRPQRKEPHGFRGSMVVLIFFLVLGLITIGSYLAFRFFLDIPSA